jgi:CRP/FNR family transcriptional regulator, cyclic AMP receptor protein
LTTSRPTGTLTPDPHSGYDLPVPTALESLAAIPLFANLSSRQLRKLARSATEDSYDAGSLIVQEGGRTETLFVILEGRARFERDGRKVGTRGAGDFFGEISMIDGRRRAASVIAETPMRCLVLYHDSLRKIAMEDPRVAWSLLQSLAGRVREDRTGR